MKPFCRNAAGIRIKLQSGRGVTILFALLTLLVCFSVGSVILTAGTAAAGRITGIADNDRRFYALNSAARLVKELFLEESITLEKRMTETEIFHYTLEKTAYGNVEEISRTRVSDDTVYTLTSGGVLLDSSELLQRMREKSIPADLALDLLLGSGNTVRAEDAFSLDVPVFPTQEKTVSYTLHVYDEENTAIAGADVRMLCSVSVDGMVTVLLSVGEEDDAYTVKLHFRAAVSSGNPMPSSVRSVAEPIDNSGSRVTFAYTVTTTAAKTQTVTWSFLGMENA